MLTAEAAKTTAKKWWVPSLSIIATAFAGYLASRLEKMTNERDARDEDIIRLLDHQEEQDKQIIELRIDVAVLKSGGKITPMMAASITNETTSVKEVPISRDRLDIYQKTRGHLQDK